MGTFKGLGAARFGGQNWPQPNRGNRLNARPRALSISENEIKLTPTLWDRLQKLYTAPYDADRAAHAITVLTAWEEIPLDAIKKITQIFSGTYTEINAPQGYGDGPIAYFVNIGPDAHLPSILYDLEEKKFLITSWSAWFTNWMAAIDARTKPAAKKTPPAPPKPAKKDDRCAGCGTRFRTFDTECYGCGRRRS